jgi:hypothetical protein
VREREREIEREREQCCRLKLAAPLISSVPLTTSKSDVLSSIS